MSWRSHRMTWRRQLSALILGCLVGNAPSVCLLGQDPEDFIVVTLHSVTIHDVASPTGRTEIVVHTDVSTGDWHFSERQSSRFPEEIWHEAQEGTAIPIERPIFSLPESEMRGQLVATVIASDLGRQADTWPTADLWCYPEHPETVTPEKDVGRALEELWRRTYLYYYQDSFPCDFDLYGETSLLNLACDSFSGSPPCGSATTALDLQSRVLQRIEDTTGLWGWFQTRQKVAEFVLVKPFDESWGVGTHRAQDRAGLMTVEYSIERLKRPKSETSFTLTLDRLIVHDNGDFGNGEIFAWVEVSDGFDVPPQRYRFPPSGSREMADGAEWSLHEILYTSDRPRSPWLYVEVGVWDDDPGGFDPDDMLGVYSGRFLFEDLLRDGGARITPRRQGLGEGDVTIELTVAVTPPPDCNDNGIWDRRDLEPVSSFGAAEFYDVGRLPFAAVAGDFDGGGGLDVATANANGNSVTVLLNRGDGTLSRHGGDFATRHPFPSSIQVGDFDLDGALDLVTGHLEGEAITILYGNGRGDFSRTDSVGTGLGPLSVAVDSYRRIATANFDTNTVSILENDGTGNFTRNDLVVGAEPQWVGFGQVKDAVEIVVVRPLVNEIQVKGSSDTSFTWDVAAAHASVERPVAVVVADFDGNGLGDLATTNLSSNNVSVLLAGPNIQDVNNHWVYWYETRIRVRSQASYDVADGPTAVAAADLDGDGDVDLVTANERASVDSGISVLVNDGRGHFEHAGNYAAGDRPVFVALADLNGDGLPEVISSVPRENRIAVLPNVSVPAFSADADHNGILDDCEHAEPGVEICNDEVDNDGDGRIDCEDEDCGDSTFCKEDLFTLKINAGGPQVVEDGIVWEADTEYLGAPAGAPFTWRTEQDASLVTAPAPPDVYWTVRHRTHRYDIGSAPDGIYRVRIHFSDEFVGLRAMDYRIEGATVLSGFRPGVAAGGANLVVTREFVVTVADGNGLQIEADEGSGNDVFEAAIEITQVAGPPEVAGLRDLVCAAGDGEVQLTWINDFESLRAVDPDRLQPSAIFVERDGEVLAVLAPDATSYTDVLLQTGEYQYTVVAVLGAVPLEAHSCSAVLEGSAPTFLRGDANGDAVLELTDAVQVLEFLFLGGERPGCLAAVDANDDDEVGLSDAVAILGFLFLGNPPALPGMGECETWKPGAVLSCDESQHCTP